MRVSFTMIAINIAFFQPPETFRNRMLEWVRLLTGSPKRPGVDRIYYPGERAGETYEDRIRNGIPVDNHTVDMLARFAEELKIESIV